MSSHQMQNNPEREQTDESLRLEREKVDLALESHQESLDKTAADVLLEARRLADGVLAAARAKTDQGSASSASAADARILRSRDRADAALRKERANADEAAADERASLDALLSLEREETDKDLHVERARADSSISMRDEFLGIVSHDLRNMLASMVGHAHLIKTLQSREDREATVVMCADRIQRAGERMGRLIGDLVDLASIEAGVLSVRRALVDPAHVVKEAVDGFQQQAATKGIVLSVHIPHPLKPVAFDGARILQVLSNCLSNAIKFTASDGRVVVSAERIDDELRFAVHDSGVGISNDHLEAIFDRYRQLNEDPRGRGLGLYIAKCIVESHGGRIWAESKLGEGSTIRFLLPA